MGSGYFSNAGVFLIDSLFGLYISAVLLRLLFQIVRADFYNPLCQAIVTVTNPVLRPLRRYIPALAGIDSASVLLIVVLQLVNTWLVALVVGVSPKFGGLLVVAVAEIVNKTIWIFMGAVIAQFVLSWVAPGGYNPVIGVINALSEPLLGPARRILPPLGGRLDLSPMVVMIVLQLLLLLAVAPLRDAGYSLL
jgi:YggT family protein